MEIIMCLSVGILFTIAVYLILSRSLLRIILGTSALTHAVHLLLITLAGLKSGSPFIGRECRQLRGRSSPSLNPDVHRHQFWLARILFRA